MKKDRLLNPQQELFLKYYLDPKSATFSNGLQSALKAGYAQDYAENIMFVMPDWLAESISDMKRLRKAEKNLEEVQNLEIFTDDGKVDSNIVGHRTKVDMFIAERLGKQKYSTRNELTGADGKDLITEQLSDEEKKKLLDLIK